MAIFKSKQSGSFVTGITKVKVPNLDVIVDRNSLNSGELETYSSSGTSSWGTLRSRFFGSDFLPGGGKGPTNQSRIETVFTGETEYFYLLSQGLVQFLIFDEDIEEANMTSIKLVFRLTSNSTNTNYPTTVSVFPYRYSDTMLDNQGWVVWGSSNTPLGTYNVSSPTTLTREITIPKAAFLEHRMRVLTTGSEFRIAIVHDLMLTDTNPGPTPNGNTSSNIATGYPKLVIGGNTASGFKTVTYTGVQ